MTYASSSDAKAVPWEPLFFVDFSASSAGMTDLQSEMPTSLSGLLATVIVWLDQTIFFIHHIYMTIKSIAETSYRGMYKVQPEDGSAFFVRQDYLPSVCVNGLEPGHELDEAQTDEMLDAGLAAAVELKAVEYLARAEQSRFGLTRKLCEKKYERKYVDMALDFLERAGYLSDARFARAWLNTRRTNHYEGRSRLLAELQSRGISRDVSQAAVDAFFEENDEDEICRKAYEKLSKKKSGDKLAAAMMQAGFTFKQLRAAEEGFAETNTCTGQ